jgi:hypothetical protein
MKKEVIDQVEKVFLETNFANLFSLPGLFKTQATLFELKTERFIKWFNKLGLPIVDNVWINCVNTKRDIEEIYSLEDFKKSGYGELISRSIAIPGFIDKDEYIDGGVSENPCIAQWQNDPLPIFVSQLMMPYRKTPKGRIEKLFYSWEFKSFESYQTAKILYGDRVRTFYPQISDISSVEFGLKKSEKEEMIKFAYLQTREQLKYFGLIDNDKPTPICMALSGGGIRSGAHIGVVRALVESNYIPVRWSGTSGGSAFAIMFAGYSEKMNGQSQ